MLWDEYIERHPDGYRYSRFCELYRGWVSRLSVTMRQAHAGGDKLFVDYAGDTVTLAPPPLRLLGVARSAVGLDVAAVTPLGADGSEHCRFQHAVGHLSRQWPIQAGGRQPFQRQPDSRRRNTYSAGNLVEPHPGGP